jgi:2-methylcitrate dehydratase PrpD
MNITEVFIDNLINKSQKIPEKVTKQSRNVLLDYLGVVAGGMRSLEEKHPELIASTPKNAFLKAFAAHVLELDDGHRQGMIHLGASIISSLLKIVEKESLTGTDLLRGIVMGYEVAVRCACALQPGHKKRGYHVSGTCGTIGAAMGIAFACGYSREQMKSTLACAVSSAAGLLEIQEQASELKPYNLGRAAQDGIMAALIGKLAIPGPEDILGGKRGFLAALTDTPNPEYLTDFKGEGFCIEGIYQKIHAACRHCHPAIDATISLRNDIYLEPEKIERIEVHTYLLAIGSHDHTQVIGVSSAKLSTPYAVALTIVNGSAGYADYNEYNLDNSTIKMLTNRVCIIEDESLTAQSPTIRGARVSIYMKDGNSYEASCMYPKGEPENPLTNEELEEKFRSLAMYGGLTLMECDELIHEIWKSEINPNKILNIVCK